MKIILLLSTLLVAASASSLRHPIIKLKDLLPQSRIVGGQLATPGQFPYQAGLFLSDGVDRWWCGGSIISEEWILTAAHCTIGAIKATVYTGTLNINEPNPYAQTIEVVSPASFILHNDYNPINLNNDISLVRLPTPLTLSGFVYPVPIVSRDEVGDSFVGQYAIASGWGKTSDYSMEYAQNLRWAYMIVETQETCIANFGAAVVTDGVICTNTQGGSVSTCEGDSGGPLVNANTGSLIGVTSFVSGGGCQYGSPAGFTRVTHYLDWIRQHTGLDV